MNNTLKSIVFVFFAFVLSHATLAQGGQKNPSLNERLTQAKLVMIKDALNLSDAQVKALAPIYRRYEAEIYELNFSRQRSMLRANPDSLTAEEADKMITAQLDNAVQISTIRRKYYPEFKSVLTPQQVIKLYKSEAQMRRRIMQEFRKRFGNRAVK